MSYSVIVQPQAERDIADAFAFIYSEAPNAAVVWYHGLKSAILSLDAVPERCALSREGDLLGYELRQLVYGKRGGRYRIVFRMIDSEVHILAVRHGARDVIEIDDTDES